MAINKLFIMLPCFLLSRKLDGEDPDTIYYVRVVYGVIQTLCVLIVAYTYIQASAIGSAKEMKTKIIYIPPAPTPFQDPNDTGAGGKTYTEAKFGAHILATARSLLMSTLFGICFTVGLHIYKGMVVGMAIQTIMGPFNLFDNVLVYALLLGKGISSDEKIFNEKFLNELSDEDIIQDENGNQLQRGGKREGRTSSNNNSIAATKKNSVVAPNSTTSSVDIEEVMLDVWDMGANADIGKLMSVVTKQNCNYQTSKDGWTPIMILAGLGGSGSATSKEKEKTVKGTGSAIRQIRDELGANPGIVDNEGWNAYHWAAFHNNADAAKELSKSKGDTAVLLQVKDKEGYTPIETATKEGNKMIAQIYTQALEQSAVASSSSEGEVRKDEENERKKDK